MFHGEIKAAEVKKAIKESRAEKLSEEIEYIRFKKPHGKIERGTVITKDGAIWGYPHIPRIFTLKEGIEKNIKTEVFYLEEKIDGYNLRIARIGRDIFAFTRGGYLDPFATEKAREMKNLAAFFDDNPAHVLCCEMVGNTPFTPPARDFDIKLFVFDIGIGTGYMRPLEKYALLKKYGIEGVPFLGRYSKSQLGLAKKIAFYLNKDKKEGMVIKSEDRLQAVKYVTPAANIDDIEKGAYTFFDVSAGFFTQRVFRSSFFIKDFGLDREKYAGEVGAAFQNGLARALADIEEGRDIDEEFQIIISDKNIFERIVSHMGKEVAIRPIFAKKENGKTTVRFSKIYKRTTKLLRGFLLGKSQID